MRGSVDTALAATAPTSVVCRRKPGNTLAGGAEHAVDRLDHRRRIAARVVAGEDAAVEAFAHEPRGRFEHARLGAAKSVDALLRVADDEDARRALPARAAARAGVAREPAVQRMPLQRARVLELVDQQMARRARRAAPGPSPTARRRAAGPARRARDRPCRRGRAPACSRRARRAARGRGEPCADAPRAIRADGPGRPGAGARPAPLRRGRQAFGELARRVVDREERRPGGGEALARCRAQERGGKLVGRIPRQLAARRGELAHSGSKQIGPRGGRDRLRRDARRPRARARRPRPARRCLASTPASSASSNSTRRSQAVSSHTRSWCRPRAAVAAA